MIRKKENKLKELFSFYDDYHILVDGEIIHLIVCINAHSGASIGLFRSMFSSNNFNFYEVKK